MIPRQAVHLEIRFRPFEVTGRKIDRDRCRCAPVGGVAGERSCIAKKIEETFSRRLIADHPACEPMIEEKSGVEVIGHIAAKRKSPLVRGDEQASLAKLFILRGSLLTRSPLEKDVFRFDSERFGSRGGHPVEPETVYSRCAAVGPFELGNMQVFPFVNIDDERDLRKIAFVEPVTGDSPFGVIPQMAGTVCQAAAELACLIFSVIVEPPEYRFGRGKRLSVF